MAELEAAELLARGIQTEEGISPVSMAIERLCISLAQVFEKQRKSLALPYDRAESVSAWLGNKGLPDCVWNEDGADETLPSIAEEE